MPTDPLDWSDKYNTAIPPDRQEEYRKWRSSLPANLNNQQDYDIQGAFLSGTGADPRSHMTDQFKKPNHPTFSNESQYDGLSGYVGGKWTDAGYKPSRTNLEFRPQEKLQQYFNQAEPTTPLLAADKTPVPTGPGGIYTIGDLSGNTPIGKPPTAPAITDFIKNLRYRPYRP